MLLLGVLCVIVVFVQVGGWFQVEIISFLVQQLVFGCIEICVDVVLLMLVFQVECFVDGCSVGVCCELFFCWMVDVGNDNEECIIEVEVQMFVGGKVCVELCMLCIEVDEVFEVDFFQVYVVVEKNGQCMMDLLQSVFCIVDDYGYVQDVVLFESGDLLFSVMLFVDLSVSMSGLCFEVVLQGVYVFVIGLCEEDEVLVVLFSDQIFWLMLFINDVVEFEG